MAKLLLVEDDRLVRVALHTVLRHAGHDVAVAKHGREALEKMAEAAFDVVITDILMPEMDGIEKILALRQASPSVKIIAISGGGASGGVDFLEMSNRLGASETLRKPIEGGELNAAVARVLASAKPDNGVSLIRGFTRAIMRDS
jgi:CheY-like chemotaxis protein